jgi:glucoamylase
MAAKALPCAAAAAHAVVLRPGQEGLRGHGGGTGSKVWYTVADGVLSDVYEPTIDNTNVSTLQYVVTDGSTFTDLQTRDMTYTVAADPTGMACTVTSTDAKHGFRLVTTYITDPAATRC